MRQKLFLILISIILVGVVFITFNFIEIYNIKSIINPNFITINHVALVSNKFVFSGDIIANSFYGAYDRCEYDVKNNRLYIKLYSNNEKPDFKEVIKLEIVDDKLYNVNEVYLKGGEDRLIWCNN